MCMKATCSNCSKATWVGCGKHVPSVLDSVPETDRCSCDPKYEFEGKQYPPKAGGGILAGVQNAMGWMTGGGKKAEEAKKEEL